MPRELASVSNSPWCDAYVNAFHGGTHARCIRLSSGSWRGDHSCAARLLPVVASPRVLSLRSPFLLNLGDSFLRTPIFSRLRYRLSPRVLGLPGDSLAWQSTRTRRSSTTSLSRPIELLRSTCFRPSLEGET